MPEVHTRRITVGVDSIDAHRHVNNQEYLRWMQELAIEHSTALGWPLERYLKSGASWYVKTHFIDYLRPARLDDELVACARICGGGRARLLFAQRILRAEQDICRAEVSVACVNPATGKPCALPPRMRAVLNAIGPGPQID